MTVQRIVGAIVGTFATVAFGLIAAGTTVAPNVEPARPVPAVQPNRISADCLARADQYAGRTGRVCVGGWYYGSDN